MSQGTRLSTNKPPKPRPIALKAVPNTKEQSLAKIHTACAQESDDLIEELKKYLHKI